MRTLHKDLLNQSLWIMVIETTHGDLSHPQKIGRKLFPNYFHDMSVLFMEDQESC